MSESPIQVHLITVRTGRLVCDIEIAGQWARYSSPKLAAFVTGHYPDLPLHACVNGTSPVFGSVIETTSVPHVLEHVAIDIQTSQAADAGAVFTGTTEWTDEERGLARVEISFRDDLQGLRAFNKAVEFLNMAVLTCLA